MPQLPRRLHARKRLAADDDPRVGLVVLKEYVVSGLEGLYQRVLQQKGILLAVNDEVAYLDYLLHEHPHLGRVVAALHEIRRDSLAQRLGLADVDDRAVLVDELVDSRRERQCGDLRLECILLLLAHEYKGSETREE